MNDEDQAYYDYLLEREAPRIPQDAVQMAEAPGATMTDAAPVAAGTVRPGAMEGQISAIPRQPVVGAVADFVGKVREFANQYEVQDWVPLLGGMSVGDLFLGKSPEEIENLAYGNFPMVMPQQSNIPVMKPGRKESVADTAFLGLDVAGLAPLAGAAARGARQIGREIATEPPTGAVQISRSAAITSSEKQAIESAAGADKKFQRLALAAEFDDVVRDDASVIGYKLTNTYGRFMRSDERALDAEFVVKSNFNPEPLRRRLIEMGKQYDQDAVFMSKVVRDGASPNVRPGVEIYFKRRQGADFVRQVTDKLAEYGVDGFTFVTDLRQSDRVNVQAMAGGDDTAGLTGIRFQYIPEFDDAFTETNRTAIVQQKEDLFRDIVSDILQDSDVSDARLVYYDTQVYFRSDYDEYLARTAGTRGAEARAEQSSGSAAAQSNRSGEVGSRSAGTVSNRIGQNAGANQTSAITRGQSPMKGGK